jgi:hypothetical protein
MTTLIHEEKEVTTRTMTKTEPPKWLLAFWKEIDDKTFGKGFDCFTEDAICNLGVADWHGREQIRENLRAFNENYSAIAASREAEARCFAAILGIAV